MPAWVPMAEPAPVPDPDEEAWTLLSDAIVAFGASAEEEEEAEEEDAEGFGVLVPAVTPRCVVADCTGTWTASFYDCGYFGTHPDFAFVSEHEQERAALQRIRELCSRAGTVRALATKGVVVVVRAGFDPATYVNALLRFDVEAVGLVAVDATALVTKEAVAFHCRNVLGAVAKRGVNRGCGVVFVFCSPPPQEGMDAACGGGGGWKVRLAYDDGPRRRLKPGGGGASASGKRKRRVVVSPEQCVVHAVVLDRS